MATPADRLEERRKRAMAMLLEPDFFGAEQTSPGTSRLDDVRYLYERGLKRLGNAAVTLPTPGILLRGVRAGDELARGAPDLLQYLTGPRGPNQPVETALAASEAGMGAGAEAGPSNPAPPGYHRMRDGTLMQDTPGMTYDSGQAPLGAPTAGSPTPPTPPGGLTRGDSQGALPSGGALPPMRRVDDIASGYPDTASGLQSTALAPLPSSTSMVGQRVETRPGVAGSLSRVDDIASSYSPRRLGAGMPGQTATGLALPSSLGRTGLGGLSPEAIEELRENPALAADILNRQRGRDPARDMWARKEQTDAARLQELFPLFEDPNNPDEDAEQTAYLQRGIEGRRVPGGRLDFRGALLAKLGDEAGGSDVLDSLGIPMALAPGQVSAAATNAAKLVNAVQVQGGRLPALAAARAQRVHDEITRQHGIALERGEEFGQPQISAIIRSLA